MNYSYKQDGQGQSLNPDIPICPSLSWILSSSNTVTNTFKYSVDPLSTSSALNITIEGGGTYLKYLPDAHNYVQNLSDAGAIMYPYINYQIFTNRLFGDIFVNQTISPDTVNDMANGRTDLPVVVNSVTLYNYQQQNYQQVSSFGSFNAYNISIAIPVAPSSGSALTLLENNYVTVGDLKNSFNYNNINVTQFFQLFEEFKESQHLASLVLNLTNEQTTYGYNRLVYTYVDRFNNTIYMPLDVDFANMTVLTLNSSTLINPDNENQTKVTVNGTAIYYTPSGYKPVPSGSDIYLYWNTNINYYNSGNTPDANPSVYFSNSLLCAIAPVSKGCQIANPLSTITQNQPEGGDEAKYIDYNPEAGGGPSAVIPPTGTSSSSSTFSGSCTPPPNSLLTPIVYNCNLFGYNGPGYNGLGGAAQQDPNGGGGGGGSGSDYQYCLPVFANGTGMYSSQLGLIQVVQTKQDSSFGYSFTACGVGQNRVVAEYYGSDAPEPTIVNQTALSSSGGDYEFAGNIIDANDIVNAQEFNYTFAPNFTTTEFEVGSYALNFGTIGIVELLAAMALVGALVGRGFIKKRAKNKK